MNNSRPRHPDTSDSALVQYKRVFLLLLLLLPVASCTNQTALKNKQQYLFIFCIYPPPPSVFRCPETINWVFSEWLLEDCTILKIKHFAVYCEVGKRISSPALWNTFLSYSVSIDLIMGNQAKLSL